LEDVKFEKAADTRHLTTDQ